jgi:hypothetical protein
MGTDTDKTRATQAEDPYSQGVQDAEADARQRAAYEELKQAFTNYAAATPRFPGLELSPLFGQAMADLVRSMPSFDEQLMLAVAETALPTVRVNTYLAAHGAADIGNLVYLPENITYPAFGGAAPGRREPVTKQSVSIPESTWAAVEALSEAEGISRSAWLSRAAQQSAAQQLRLAVARQAAEEYAAEYEAEHGPISDEAVAAAREALGLDEDEQVQAA